MTGQLDVNLFNSALTLIAGISLYSLVQYYLSHRDDLARLPRPVSSLSDHYISLKTDRGCLQIQKGGHWLWGHEKEGWETTDGQFYVKNHAELGTAFAMKGAFFVSLSFLMGKVTLNNADER